MGDITPKSGTLGKNWWSFAAVARQRCLLLFLTTVAQTRTCRTPGAKLLWGTSADHGGQACKGEDCFSDSHSPQDWNLETHSAHLVQLSQFYLGKRRCGEGLHQHFPAEDRAGNSPLSIQSSDCFPMLPLPGRGISRSQGRGPLQPFVDV